jgi:cholesterol oxidase
MGHDAADGELRLARRRLAPWATDLHLHWPAESNRALMQAIVRTHRALSDAAGGRVRVPLYWRLRGGTVSVHPLGGCPMGRSAADGVVDHTGAVFGYPGLFVCDGAIVPTAIGRNPSLTIAAIAERIADLMVSR